MEVSWQSYVPFSPPSTSTSYDFWLKPPLDVIACSKDIMHTFIIDLQWSSNQCRFQNWSGETPLLHHSNWCGANVAFHLDLSSSTFIRVSNGGVKGWWFIHIQVYHFLTLLVPLLAQPRVSFLQPGADLIVGGVALAISVPLACKVLEPFESSPKGNRAIRIIARNKGKDVLKC